MALLSMDSHVQRNLLAEMLRSVGLDAADYDDVEKIMQALLRRTKELQASEGRLRIVAEHTYDWEYWMLPDGRLEYCSPSSERITGYADQEFMTDPDLLNRIVHPEDIPVWREHQYAAGAEAEHLHAVFRIITRTGKEVWISHHCVAVITRDGQYRGRRASNRDISLRKQAMEELRQKSEELELYFKFSLDLLCIANVDGRFVRLNPEWENVLGYSVSELEGRMFLDFVHPDDVASTMSAISRLERQDDVAFFENRYRRNDGSYRWIEWRSRPMGRQIYATARDITDRKAIAEALQKSEETHRNIIQASPMGIHLYQLREDGALIFMGGNPAADSLLRVDHAKFVGKTIEQAFPPLRTTEIPDRYRRAALHGETWHAEQTEYDHDGIAGSFEVHAFQMSPGNVAVLFSDISERKRTEEALLESEEVQRKILQAVPDLIIKTDMEGRITFVNEMAFPGLENVPETSITGKNAFSFIARHDLRRASQDARLRLQKNVGPREYQLRFDEGDLVDVEVNGAVIRDGTLKPQGMVYVIRDITERKRAEDERKRLQSQLVQAQKMESVGILAGGVAHDFNNLLQAMGGNIELLLRNKTDDHPDSPRLRTVSRAMDRAAQLVRQLLVFSRKSNSRKTHVDLNHEVENVAGILERTIPKMIDIELHLDPAPWPLFADPVQIEQILLNMAGNSVDAMPMGGRLIIETANMEPDPGSGRMHPGPKTGRHVLLTFSDTGCGMTRDVLEHIFDPFFTTKEVGKGTGLGLASAYGIVQDHGGHIQCCSEPGKGTTFRVYLPAAEKNEQAVADSLPKPSPMGGDETILVVDDDPEIMELTREALEDFGYVVLCAANGEETLDIFREHGQTIDLVLLDLNMPGMGGHKCLQELLRFDPAVRVLISSGYSANGQAGESLKSGALGFIGKPYQLKELEVKVREALGKG